MWGYWFAFRQWSEDLQTWNIGKPWHLLSYPVIHNFRSVCNYFMPNVALIAHLSISVWLIYYTFGRFILSSIQKKKKWGNTSAESCWVILCRRETACQKCSLATRWMRSVWLSPTASFLTLHSQNLFNSAVSPQLFAFAVSRDVGLPGLNSLATF